MDIEFSDIEYKVHTHYFRPNAHSKTLLKSISGKFLSNQLTAIIGASGAGKSTLLNILSRYKIETCSQLTGTITIDSKPFKKLQFSSKYKKSICFIAQEDLLPTHLDVNESMMIAAQLKLPKSISVNEKQIIIDDILTNINLHEQKSTITSKLSGGQRKRLSIALELINNPATFFLDEPTSGLDNVSTMNCLKILKKLSKQNRTLICTIHQPSASMFQLFDNVYVLAQGRCVYYGDTQRIVEFLSSINISCPIYYNPADLIIEVTNGDDSQLIEKCTLAIENGKNHSYMRAEDYEPIVDKDLQIIEKLNFISLNSDNKCQSVYPISQIYQFQILLQKMMRQICRNKTVFYIQLFHYVICAITVGLVFYNVGNDGIEVFNHLKFCMGTILFLTYTQIMIPVLIFPEEIALVKKENFNKWYHVLPYYSALTVSKLPLQIFFNYIFITITYIMVGFPMELKRFLLFSLVGNLISFTSESLGLMIGSVFDVTKGCVVGPAIILPFLGLLVYGFDFMPQIPYFNRFILNLSFMRCGANALFMIVFGLDRNILECSEEFCFFRHPNQVIQFLSIDDFTISDQITYLLISLLFCRLFVYFVLIFRFRT